MLSDANEIRSLAASGGDELSGVLRLGLPPTIGPYLLPRLIPELQKQHSHLKLYVREELPSGLVQALLAGQHDLIMTLLPVADANLASETLFREPLFVAVAKDHRLAAKQTVRRADLRGEDILALGQGHQLHDAVLALSEDFGARIRFDYEGTSLDTLREMVAMGMGITFLPGMYASAVAAADPSLRLLEMTDRKLHRTVGLVWRQSSARQDGYLELAQLVRSLTADAGRLEQVG